VKKEVHARLDFHFYPESVGDAGDSAGAGDGVPFGWCDACDYVRRAFGEGWQSLCGATRHAGGSDFHLGCVEQSQGYGGRPELGQIQDLITRRNLIVRVANAKIRASADDSAALVFSAEKNVLLEMAEPASAGWVKVRHRDEQLGCVKVNEVWVYNSALIAGLTVIQKRTACCPFLYVMRNDRVCWRKAGGTGHEDSRHFRAKLHLPCFIKKPPIVGINKGLQNILVGVYLSRF
jgi:hypothetical protein